jgi:hypothetical protein
MVLVQAFDHHDAGVAEREHEEDDAIVGNDPGTIAALRDCGLLKFFRIRA